MQHSSKPFLSVLICYINEFKEGNVPKLGVEVEGCFGDVDKVMAIWCLCILKTSVWCDLLFKPGSLGGSVSWLHNVART